MADAARGRSTPVVPLVLLCVLWYLSSALSSNTSKGLMSRRSVWHMADGQRLTVPVREPPLFPYPVTLTLLQFVFVNVLCYVGTRRELLGDWTLAPRLVPITLSRIREVGQISVFNVLGHALGSVAISRVPVSMVHTIKALSPLFTVLAYVYLFHVVYSTRTYVSLLPLILGVVLACSTLSTRSSDDVVGFGAALGSTLIFVAQNIYSKKLLKPSSQVSTGAPEKLDKVNILFYSSACSILLMVPMCIYYDVPKMAQQDAPSLTLWTLVLITSNGLVHFLQNLLAFQVLTHVSPVTYSIANLFKRVFVILLAIVWFGQHVTPVQWVGIALTFLGLYLYNDSKAPRTQPAEERPMELPTYRRAPTEERPPPRTTPKVLTHDALLHMQAPDAQAAHRVPSRTRAGGLGTRQHLGVRMETPLFSLPPQ